LKGENIYIYHINLMSTVHTHQIFRQFGELMQSILDSL